MSRFAIGAGPGQKMRGEVALGVMLVAAGVIGVTMWRGAPETDSQASTTTVPQVEIAAGQVFVPIAMAAGSYPPHLAPGHIVQLFGSTPEVDEFTPRVVTGSSSAVVHAVDGDPSGPEAVITLVADASLAEFLVAATDVRLVITGATP